MKARAFSIILLSFVAGIFLAPFFDIEISIFKYLTLGIFTLAIIFFRKNIWIRTFLITFAVFFIAIFRYSSFQPTDDTRWIGNYNGKDVEIVGVVDSDPESDKVTKMIINTKSVNGDQEIKGKVLVTTRNHPRYEFGDKLKIKGMLEGPPELGDFSYKNYLSRFGVYSVMSFPETEKTKSQHVERSSFESVWFKTRLGLTNVRKLFESSVELSLPEPHASFMNGLILGSKKSIPDWLLDDFKATGTTHIIALSGFNITIIVFVLKNMTHGLSRRLSFWLPLGAVFLFVVLTGAAASVVRAAIMGTMFLLSKRLGRQSNAFAAIATTAAVMVYLNPLILRFDIGFQLSFAAFVGLIYLTPLVERYFLWLPKFISQNLSLTLAAQITAAPILIYNFGSLSLISPIANILILPFIPLAMALGFVSAVLVMIFEPLGRLVGYISYGILEYMIQVVGYFSKLPFASVDIEMKNALYIFLYYFVLFDITLLIKQIQNKKTANHIVAVADKKVENVIGIRD